jgi:negative regulator of flagellin synthesis FlgM
MPDAIRGVNTSDPVAATSTAQTGASNSTSSASPAASGSPGADLADVTQTEALLQSIVQAANNVPGIDQTKIAELQQAITSGTYQANPQSIAQKLVELDGQLDTAGQVR